MHNACAQAWEKLVKAGAQAADLSAFSTRPLNSYALSTTVASSLRTVFNNSAQAFTKPDAAIFNLFLGGFYTLSSVPTNKTTFKKGFSL
jgi:hypothetical protein